MDSALDRRDSRPLAKSRRRVAVRLKAEIGWDAGIRAESGEKREPVEA
jgi:hypothetical protein